MKQYVCSICGYIYKETEGIPEAGISPGTQWEELPEQWVCPLCGAPKTEFKEQGAAAPVKKQGIGAEPAKDWTELSSLEISALCSNLARGCEKQYKAEEAALFTQLADYFKGTVPAEREPSADKLLALIQRDLEEGFPAANFVSAEARDRGALRALVWSEKVTRILNSLLARYEREGDSMLAHTGVYVCTICGFVWVGETPPEICPVCKVPSWKFERIQERGQN